MHFEPPEGFYNPRATPMRGDTMNAQDKKKLAAILMVLMVLKVGIAFLVLRYGWWGWGP